MAEVKEEKIVFQRPEALCDVVTHYCPGCLHGVVHRVIAEVIDELGIREITVGVAPVGCSVLAYNYINTDFAEAAHGRAPAMATGMKRVHPELVVFTYQGDGDLAAIGTNELIHAATRGENITTVFINNAIYGMTGGQMAPTTLPGQVTTSTPMGRDTKLAGFPVRVCEMVSTLEGAAYIVRRSAYSPSETRKLKAAIKTAFQVQMAGLGYSLIEVVSNCPTNWGMTPLESLKWLQENMLAYYPLGDYKVKDSVKELIGKK
jgi:2-oxoglutarate ferredoxin oxidoreductase subunit beta